MRKIILFSCCFALLPTLLAAQDQDAHFRTQAVASIARASTFLHGYLHGYEEGFHQGDFDLQMGRSDRGDGVRNESPKGYRKDFGPKDMYKNGFHQGFAVGYADAAAGRRFRAFETVQSAVALMPTVNGKKERATFDDGMHVGYLAGQHQGLADARRELQAQPSPACPAAQPGFCTAYAEVFQLGYSDGFTKHAKTTMAEK